MVDLTRFAVVDRSRGHVWTGEWDGWSPFVEDARTFPNEADALLAAYHECAQEPNSYTTMPVTAQPQQAVSA